MVKFRGGSRIPRLSQTSTNILQVASNKGASSGYPACCTRDLSSSRLAQVIAPRRPSGAMQRASLASSQTCAQKLAMRLARVLPWKPSEGLPSNPIRAPMVLTMHNGYLADVITHLGAAKERNRGERIGLLTPLCGPATMRSPPASQCLPALVSGPWCRLMYPRLLLTSLL